MSAMIRKLIVEVVEARDLLPKDGMGTSSPYAIIDFDGQRKRTQTFERNLNPTWNEILEFKVSNSNLTMAGELLEVDVLHDRKFGPTRRSNFLGRVRIDSRHFVRKGEEALQHFPLEKKSLFSWIKGDIGLRIYYVDEPENPPEPVVPPEAPPEAPPAEGAATDPPAEGAATEQPEAEAPTGAAAPPTEQPAEPPAQESEQQPPAEQPPESPPVTNPNANETTEAEPQAAEKTLPPQAPQAEPEKEAATPKWVPPPQPRPPAQAERAPKPVPKSSFDLVDKMHYLFVRIVRGRSLPNDAKPHVRIEALGRHVSTQTARRGAFFEWNQTFAFTRDSSVAAESSTLEISVWDLPPNADVTTADAGNKHFLGGLCFDVSEVPTRDPPDSPLALQWYKLEGSGARIGDLMLATWVGTQADESFPDSIKVENTKDSHVSSRSKVYTSPKLWYLRATVIEANDTITAFKETVISVRASLGFQSLKTRPTSSRNGNPLWNEDLIFVAAEPFGEEKLGLSLEIRNGKDTVMVGSAAIELSSVERRLDDRKVTSRWLDLSPTDEIKKGRKGNGRLCGGGRLHVRVCLDGGYHVADEPPNSASDFRPSARQLWRDPIGAVELGIIGCKNLLPMKAIDGKGSTDSYAVAKYGPKWARTRAIPDSFDPSWNEQYTWPVYDPCTVLTVGVFDESDGSKESPSHPMGKIRIRISTLEMNRGYRCSYPLILLLPSGAKKMGEIEIAVRFSRAVSSLDLLHVYGQPMLPPMHHVRPIGATQRDPLRLAAARIVAAHLARSEPSLKKEVVIWMLDAADPRGFSMRKVRANYQRIVSSMSWIVDVVRWTQDTRSWRNPTVTVIAHVLMVLLVCYPELIVPTLALYMFGIGLWRYRYRVRVPLADPSVRLSGADAVDREELDEEFDPIPSQRGMEVVRVRYDRARTMGARVQTLLGDVAAATERMQALVTWRDPRATGMFVGVCLLVAAVLFMVPGKICAVVAGFYWLRHPVFRGWMPAPMLNYLRRLPALSDRII